MIFQLFRRAELAEMCPMTEHSDGHVGDCLSIVMNDTPPVGTIIITCHHGHGDVVTRACAGCTARTQRQAETQGLTCDRCRYDGTEPHKCLCDVRIRWLDGSITIVQEVTR